MDGCFRPAWRFDIAVMPVKIPAVVAWGAKEKKSRMQNPSEAAPARKQDDARHDDVIHQPDRPCSRGEIRSGNDFAEAFQLRLR